MSSTFIVKCSFFMLLFVLIHGHSTDEMPKPLMTESLTENAEERRTGDSDVKNSMVKIYTFYNKYDPKYPWSSEGSRKKSGSGIVIQLPDSDKKVILTNGHVVSSYTYIEGRKNGQTDRHKLKLFSVSHELDLALLVPFDDGDSEMFFSDLPAVPLAKIPPLQTDLMLVGYPMGGDTISVTKGILSRLEYQPYTNSGFSFLAGQVDAASNPGNSGGPAVVKGMIVGVAMQGYNPWVASNIAYIVPTETIQQFLKDIADGQLHGVPSLGIKTQALENSCLKAFYGVSDKRGVLVIHVIPGSAADGILQPNDVILELDGQAVGNDKTIVFRGSDRVSMDYVVNSRQIGENLDILVLREKKELKLTVTLTEPVNSDVLVGFDGDAAPSYFIYQGLVFAPATREMLDEAHKQAECVTGLERTNLNNYRFTDQDEIVLIQKVLPHEENRGYHDIFFEEVDRVGSVKVKNLGQLIDLIESESKDLLELSIGYKGLRKIVLDTQKSDAVNTEVMKLNHIQYDRSENLRSLKECSGSDGNDNHYREQGGCE